MLNYCGSIGKRVKVLDRGKRRVLAWSTLLALGLTAAPVFGQQAATSVSQEIPKLGTAPYMRWEEGSMRLSLDEAISVGLARNLSLVVERYSTSEAGLNLWRSQGIYDPNLTVDLSNWEDTSPQASQLDGAEVSIQEAQRWDFGINKLFSSGGQGSIVWNNSRFETNSQFATLNPSYRVDFDLNFTQPLMRDFGRLATNYQIRVAQTNIDISQEAFELQVIATLQDIVDAYWNLLDARAQLEVADESLTLAQQLHEQNRIRVDVGTLAPLELVQSEAGVATRQLDIIRARAAVGDAEDRLRQLMNLPPGELWETEILPETDPELEPIDIDIDDAIGTALAERPELRSKRLGQNNLDLDVQFFTNQQKPRIDLALTYGLNGLGGDLTLREFPSGEIIAQASGDYGDALDQITEGDFDTWAIALNLAYPLNNRTAKAQTALAEVSFERGQAELRDLELGVSTEVRRIARLVDAAAQARESARVSRRLEERNLDAEQKRFDNGMSTSFQVLQIQEDLTEARSREVASVTGYRKALVQYYRAIGRLTEEAGVEIARPEE
jgi:HAE1 family hydrophobic/amphiphilic exporter-1